MCPWKGLCSDIAGDKRKRPIHYHLAREPLTQPWREDDRGKTEKEVTGGRRGSHKH
jgi:hypothetical protein